MDKNNLVNIPEDEIQEIYLLLHDFRVILTDLKRYKILNYFNIVKVIQKIKKKYKEYISYLLKNNSQKIDLDLDKLIINFGLLTVYLSDMRSIYKSRTKLNKIYQKYKIQNMSNSVAFYDQYIHTLEEINDPFKQILLNIQQEAFDLNYESIFDLIKNHSWTDYDRLAQNAELYLKSNSNIFRQQYIDFVTDYGIKYQADLSDTYQNLFIFYNDIEKTFGNFEIDSLFNQIDRICNKGNMTFKKSNRLTLDFQDHKRKLNTGYLGFAGNAGNPKFVIIGKKGYLGTNLHEAGHAIHYLNFDNKLSDFSKNFGNMAITEAVAFLFNSLHFSSKFLNNLRYNGKFDIQKYIKYQTMSHTYTKLYQAIRFLNFRDIYNIKDKYNADIFTELKFKAESRFQENFGFFRPMVDCFELSDQIMLPATYYEAYCLSDFLHDKLQTMSKTEEEWWENEDALEWLKKTIINPGFSLDLSKYPYLQ